MSIGTELSTYLKTKTAITNVVGSRVYQSRAPQTSSQTKVAARIVYRELPGSVRHRHATGVSGLVEAAIQLQMTDGSFEDAATLYELVRNEIDVFRGTWGSTTIKFCFLSPPYDATGDPSQGDDQGYPTVGAVAEVMYVEASPVQT